MVRIGFVGSGGIAGAHMHQLATLRNAKLVGFCDIDATRAGKAAENYGGTAYTSHEEMYEEEDLDAIYICIPPSAHTDQELLAIQRGLGVFVEKPIASTMAKAEQIAQALDDKGVVNSVGYHWRYLSVTDRAKDLLAGKQVGFALGYWIGGMPGVHWWRVMAQSGGQIVEQTTHIFDLARYFLGDVTEVSAFGATGLMTDVEDYDVHDSTVANLVFESGVIANITSACIGSAEDRVGLQLFAKKLTAKLGVVSGAVELEVVEPGRRQVITNDNVAMMEEDREFVNAVESGDTSRIRSPYRDALETLKVTLAANESIGTGEMVSL